MLAQYWCAQEAQHKCTFIADLHYLKSNVLPLSVAVSPQNQVLTASGLSFQGSLQTTDERLCVAQCVCVCVHARVPLSR